MDAGQRVQSGHGRSGDRAAERHGRLAHPEREGAACRPEDPEESARACNPHDGGADPGDKERAEEDVFRVGEARPDEACRRQPRPGQCRRPRAEPVDRDPGQDQREAGAEQVRGEDPAELGQAEPEVAAQVRADRREAEGDEGDGRLGRRGSGQDGPG